MSTDDLTRASQAFAHWRQTRTHNGEHTPAHLRQMAVDLMDHYPSNRICKRLGLSGSNLYRWSRQPPREPTASFVPLPNVPASEPGLALSLSLADDLKLTLQGDISAIFVAQLVEAIRS